ncbi:quinone-dependent dihydroorotate dehydrogenase [Peredibacter starrii]|uniref:Dihydroorotate dehydrogenase (quinone) n=1 Tax=Peredibacter starrii TaxID=28202 RepID=A0AAX4HL59_9BACT|nr:quinone-dependent dihydroorotate dehydrogenase [Peredibacter starrii]WPU63985.1 quinone-dependent dihydroorotate dehydrogenase [Peredibacter starrii]
MLYPFIKPLLFRLEPETAHNLTIEMAKLSPVIGKLTGQPIDSRLSLKVGSVNWTFPIGLAAGLDKNAEALTFMGHQGFGAIECGTVTLKPQLGNPRPRMFRYPDEQSLRNAMGFPNQGLLEILPRLRAYGGATPLGVNIGKNKDTTAEESIEELSLLLETMEEAAQYFVINVSSPNTPGLRALQEKTYLSELFTELNKVRNGKDLYLKIAPDLDQNKIVELTHLAQEYKLTGIIATNTTIMPDRGVGGVSGVLLREKSREVRKIILKESTNLELIAVGGITDPQDLFNLWKDGGKVAQVYTAYVYQGPDLLKKFHQELVNFVKKQNMTLEKFFELPLSERQYRL